jgi:mannitol-1-phosphate/altronate dehydrogenase
VVSTGIGVEGLPLDPGQHYLLADTAEEFAAAVVRVLLSPAVGEQLAATARALVEARFSNRTVAHQFERICLNALVNRRGRGAQPLAGAA